MNHPPEATETPIEIQLSTLRKTLGDDLVRDLEDSVAPNSAAGSKTTPWATVAAKRTLYDIDCPQLAGTYLRELADNLTDPDCPPELSRLGRTLRRWHHQIINWHQARVTNGPTEAVNNLIKRVKRTAFGFRRFANYRIRALLYAGKPNWGLLNTNHSPQHHHSPLISEEPL